MFRPEDKTSIEEKVRSELQALGLDPIEIIDAVPPIMKRLGSTGRKSTGTITPKSNILNIAQKMTSFAEAFADEEISRKDFLKASLKDADLFFAKPETIRKNVDGVIELLGDEGLTAKEFVEAALGHPQLFGQSPQTLNANIRGVVEHFKEDGLTVNAYLHKAALAQPSLFSMNPDTIASHMRISLDMYKKGHIQFRDKFYDETAKYPLMPMMDYLLANPVLLKSSTQNLTLRDVYAGASGKNTASMVLRGEGAAIREYMFKQGDHNNPNAPVPYMEEPGERASEKHQELWAKRTALRALVRSGILPGKVEEGPGR